MSAARAPMQATTIESEALWDNRLRELVKPLFSLQHDFTHYVEYRLMASDPREDDNFRSYFGDIIKDDPNIMFDPLNEEGDQFRKEFNLAISAIENYLRPKLA